MDWSDGDRRVGFAAGDQEFGRGGGRCYVGRVEVLSNETSSGGGRRLKFLLACDPTILGVGAAGDLWLDQYTPDSEDRLER